MSGERISAEETARALACGLALRPAFEGLWRGYVRALRSHRSPAEMDASEAADRREAAEGARVALLAWCSAHGYGAPPWCSGPVR